MNVTFNENDVIIKFAGKKIIDSKEKILFSLENEIAKKGFIVNNTILRQDIGDYIYYQFFYFDRITSRDVKISIPKKDSRSIQTVDTIKRELEFQNQDSSNLGR